MTANYRRWRALFLLCLGIFAGTAFCMKWMEEDLVYNGRTFTIIGLEISYSKQELSTILAGIDGKVKTILYYHLSFDFVFMAGVYPGIAAVCMMARERCSRPLWKKVLLILALLQSLACICDIVENCYLLQWIKEPVIGNEI